jgi:hypothetical protein
VRQYLLTQAQSAPAQHAFEVHAAPPGEITKGAHELVPVLVEPTVTVDVTGRRGRYVEFAERSCGSLA